MTTSIKSKKNKELLEQYIFSDKEKEMYRWFDEQMRFDKLPETTNKQSIEVLDNFKQRIKTKTIDADIILVSNRHLFRMPYSLHEKTSPIPHSYQRNFYWGIRTSPICQA